MFIWKVGHALHLHHPTFRSVTNNDRIRDVCQKLGFRKPAIPQSMYIYKNTGIGGEGSYEVSEYDSSNSFVNTFHMFSISQTASGCQLFVHGTKLDHRFLDPIARCHHWEWLPVVHQRLTQGGPEATVNLIQTYLLIEWIIFFAHFFSDSFAMPIPTVTSWSTTVHHQSTPTLISCRCQSKKARLSWFTDTPCTKAIWTSRLRVDTHTHSTSWKPIIRYIRRRIGFNCPLVSHSIFYEAFGRKNQRKPETTNKCIWLINITFFVNPNYPMTTTIYEINYQTNRTNKIWFCFVFLLHLNIRYWYLKLTSRYC